MARLTSGDAGVNFDTTRFASVGSVVLTTGTTIQLIAVDGQLYTANGRFFYTNGLPASGTVDSIEVLRRDGALSLRVEALGLSVAELNANAGTADPQALIAAALGGTDQLFGAAGSDLLRGYAGDDVILGLDGDDQLQGGAGNDSLFGNQGNDRLFGEAGSNTLHGGRGEDVLTMGSDGSVTVGFGNLGADTLLGSIGIDLLYGGRENDLLDGSGGGDRLFGERGDDTLGGGTAGDWFVATLDGGRDLVTDFTPAEGDRIAMAVGVTLHSVVGSGADTVVVFADGSQFVLLGVAVQGFSEDWVIRL